MNLLFVNYTHPATQHIAAQRFSKFASAMAKRGHRVVLLTAGTAGHATADPNALPALLADHDWSAPLHLAIETGALPGGAPGPLGRIKSAWNLLTNGHVPMWPIAARRFIVPIAQDFKPDAVWAVFGSVSDLVTGQSFARACKCAFVIDFKDNVDKFIPAAMRPIFERRFAGATALTANAEFHATIAQRILGGVRPSVVYSGVASDLVFKTAVPPSTGAFEIAIMGSAYTDANRASLRFSLEQWLASKSLAEQQRIVLHLIAGQNADLAPVLKTLSCQVQAHPYLNYQHLHALLGRVSASLYVFSPLTFHHKLLELLSTGRPTIAFGIEHEESRQLAKAVNGLLWCCPEPNDLRTHLETAYLAWRNGHPVFTTVDLAKLSWDHFAQTLESALSQACVRQRGFLKDGASV